MKQALIHDEQMKKVLESAAKFQKLVPDAVLVGGSAVSAHIGHRSSFDHDHVLADLDKRFLAVFEMLNAQAEWKTAHVVDGKRILGSFDGVEAGLRQLRRNRPLETERIKLESGGELLVPTVEELIRIKAFLVTNRGQVRDYLDTAALADRFGEEFAARVLLKIDDYYEKQLSSEGSVASSLVILLGEPAPKDSTTIAELPSYKGIEPKYGDWNAVLSICKKIACFMVSLGEA
jgi:hypothetical protein